MKRIAVLTSGGDVPGLNACIRAVTRTALACGVEVVGVQHGYAGLMRGEMIMLDSRAVGGIMQRGGTFLGTARSKVFETAAGQELAAQQLERAGIDGLIVIGGGTDISIGVDTALNTIMDAIGRVKDTASSHHRAFLIETMGHNSGYLALVGGLVSGAELALIPERPMQPEAVATVIERAYRLGKEHCIIIVAEGWRPGIHALQEHLHQHNSKFLEEQSFDVREVVLGHVQRGGTPTAFDRMLATRLGVFATEQLLAGTGNGMMAGLHGNQVGLVSLREATSRRCELDPELLRLADMMAS